MAELLFFWKEAQTKTSLVHNLKKSKLIYKLIYRMHKIVESV